MGKVLNNRTLTVNELFRLSSPVLLCSDRPDFNKVITEADYQAVSLNLLLAHSLVGLPERELPLVITDRIRDSLPNDNAVYLTDYEMLFDPRYELDVIRLFIDLSRHRKLIVKWCGTIEGETLTYAEPSYADYRRYNINDYNITVVK